MTDRAGFIARNLAATRLSDLDLSLWLAHPGSGLSRLGGAAPYWAYVWAGGAALAAHVRARPDVVQGRRVLDFGAGSGVVGIAAALAGARQVLIHDPDPWARAACRQNAGLNGVRLAQWRGGAVDVVLAGDVFYAPAVAQAALAALTGLQARGAMVLVGDPGRRDLPLDRLAPVARYPVRDMGDPPGHLREAGVWRLKD